MIEKKSLRQPRGGGFCSWGCGQRVTAGLSRKTHKPFNTCGVCRKRYAFRALIRRLEREMELPDTARAMHARMRRDQILAEYKADRTRYEWTPEDDEYDTLPERG